MGRTFEDDDFHRFIGFSRLDDVEQFIGHFFIDGIEILGIIELNDSNTVLDSIVQFFELHMNPSSQL